MKLKLILAFIVLFSLAALAPTWGKWNGITVGSSSGNVSKMNGVTIGTTTGNIGSYNGLTSPGGAGCGSAPAEAHTPPAGKDNGTAGTAISTTITAGTLNDTLFAFVYTGGASPAPTVADNATGGTNTYHNDLNEVSGYGVWLFSAPEARAGATSVTVTASGQAMIVYVAEYNRTLAFDQSAVAAPTGSPYSSGNSGTTACPNELLLGIVGTGHTASALYAASGSWTNPVADHNNSGDGDDSQWQEQIVSSTGAYAATGTTNATTDPNVVLIGTYK